MGIRADGDVADAAGIKSARRDLAAQVAFGIIRGGLRFEAPSVEIDRIERDAEEIGGDEPELRGTDADDTHDGTIDGGDNPALPEFPAQQDRAENGQDARDVIQTNAVE